jgi:Tfp pilus assembly protein PilN
MTVSDTAGSIVVSGLASTRQTLSAFVKKLEVDSVFSSVSIPVSDFTKSTNLEFALSITVKPNAL